MGEQHANSPLIPAAWADEDRVRERAFTELATEATAAAGPAGLGSSTGSPRARLLDLSVVDGRFSPGLIDATIRHLLDAWEQETLAPAQRLTAITSPDARGELLRGETNDPRLRFAIRDIELTGWEPLAVDPDSTPPSVTVQVSMSAARYLIAADGHIAMGTANVRHDIELHWTLELVGSPETPWRLAHSVSISGML